MTFVAFVIGLWVIALVFGAWWVARFIDRRHRERALLVDGICPNCGRTRLVEDSEYSGVGWRPVFRCLDCGKRFGVPRRVVEGRIRVALRAKLDEKVARLDEKERR